MLLLDLIGAALQVLYQVPNQPIVFTDDPKQESRSEDAIIAWTWCDGMCCMLVLRSLT